MELVYTPAEEDEAGGHALDQISQICFKCPAVAGFFLFSEQQLPLKHHGRICSKHTGQPASKPGILAASRKG
jgi:hypothetical protein